MVELFWVHPEIRTVVKCVKQDRRFGFEQKWSGLSGKQERKRICQLMMGWTLHFVIPITTFEHCDSFSRSQHCNLENESQHCNLDKRLTTFERWEMNPNIATLRIKSQRLNVENRITTFERWETNCQVATLRIKSQGCNVENQALTLGVGIAFQFSSPGELWEKRIMGDAKKRDARRHVNCHWWSGPRANFNCKFCTFYYIM